MERNVTFWQPIFPTVKGARVELIPKTFKCPSIFLIYFWESSVLPLKKRADIKSGFI